MSTGPGDVTTLVEQHARRRSASPLSLRVVGEGLDATHPLPSNGQLVIGRGDDSDVVIDDPSVSRRHAQVLIDAERVRIEDLGSANGTRVGELELAPGQPVDVAPGEVIDVGTVMLILQPTFAGRRLRRFLPHAYFQARLEEECARASGPFVVARVHVEGAPAEHAAEATIAEALRASDVAAIYAPGEYELLLATSTLEEALEVVGRAVRLLAARGIGAATGVAAFPGDGRAADALLAVACRGLSGGDDEQEDVNASSVVVMDPAMQRLHRLVRRIAPGQISVLLLGETGVGKEVVAETIHRLSPRAEGPFVRLNCGGFSDALLESELFGHEKGAFTGAVQAKGGLLESASGGTVFLDEIGELPIGLQVKLLRVLEDREVMPVGSLRPRRIDVRFVAATNRDLEAEILRGTFRQDLYYRINGVALVIPPLRDRVSEIRPLARLFASRAAGQAGQPAPALSAEAIALLESYPWPGNIRELRNAIERAVLLSAGATVEREHLPAEKLAPPLPAADEEPAGQEPAPAAAAGSLRDDLDELERRRILDALDQCAGNQTRAARMLGMARGTLVARLTQYGVPRPRKP